jgi:hypothetical protein
MLMQSEEGQKKIAMNFCVSHFRTEMEVRLVAEGARDPLEQMQSHCEVDPHTGSLHLLFHGPGVAGGRGGAAWIASGSACCNSFVVGATLVAEVVCWQAKYCIDKILQDVSYDDGTYYKAEPLTM